MDQWASVFSNSPHGGRADAPVSRLAVSCRDGTADLQAMAKELSKRELAALGLSAVLTGTDVYGARVTLTNTGTVPVRVYPENVQVHFGTESADVTTAAEPRFLRACFLQPKESAIGLVMYRAAIEIGATMRLDRGSKGPWSKDREHGIFTPTVRRTHSPRRRGWRWSHLLMSLEESCPTEPRGAA